MHTPELDRLPQPRWWHRLRAALGGYFWKPCPVCGRFFGGQEWADANFPSIPDAEHPLTSRHGVCSKGCAQPEIRWPSIESVNLFSNDFREEWPKLDLGVVRDPDALAQNNLRIFVEEHESVLWEDLMPRPARRPLGGGPADV